MARICYAASSSLTFLFLVWFFIVENNSPGLSFAVVFIGMPLPLLLFSFSKSTKSGITKDGKGAGWAALAIATAGFAYIATFFGGWIYIAGVWLLSFGPALVGSLRSATTQETNSDSGQASRHPNRSLNSSLSTEASPWECPSNTTSDASGSSPEAAMVKNWLIFIVVATLGGALAGMLAGAVIGGLLGASGAPMQRIRIASGIAGFVAGLPVSYLTFRWRVKCLLQETASHSNHDS